MAFDRILPDGSARREEIVGTDETLRRWAWFTDEEMRILSNNVRGDYDLTQDIEAECKRRGMDTR